MIKSKIGSDSGETWRKMILVPSHAALPNLLEMLTCQRMVVIDELRRVMCVQLCTRREGFELRGA